MEIQKGDNYNSLVQQIAETYQSGRRAAVQAVNPVLVETCWKIGQHIVEFEQGGNTKAEYGEKLLRQLSKDLSLSYGRGFSLSNLYMMRLFYIKYPIFQTASGISEPDEKKHPIGATLSHLLSWSHYVELLKIENGLERSFYEKQSIIENWNVRELKRQKKTSLFLRLASGKNKEEILRLSQQGKIIEKPEDLLKDTYVFEFLKIPEPYHISETDLETRLINQLQEFFEKEVLPFAPDAWWDKKETKIGYEINFNKYFYQYQPPRSLKEIAADIFAIEEETENLLKEIVS